jgi:hypothetical protein
LTVFDGPNLALAIGGKITSSNHPTMDRTTALAVTVAAIFIFAALCYDRSSATSAEIDSAGGSTPTPAGTPSLSPLPTPSPPCPGGSAFWSHFSNTEPIAPADRSSNDPGTPPGLPTNYPSIVHVTGIFPPIADSPNTCWLAGMAVTFTLTSERPDDLDILLVAPNGNRSIIISDAGGNAPITNSGYLFDYRYHFSHPFPDELTPYPG